jgi:ribosome-associated protein
MSAAGDAATGDLRVTPRLTIPAEELDLSFQTSGGPGGQHANRSATGVSLSWSFATSSVLSDHHRDQIGRRLGKRAQGGVIRVVADRSRSQWRNRSLARSRLAELVADALRPATPRRPTGPSRASTERRLAAKSRKAEKKALRRRPDVE